MSREYKKIIGIVLLIAAAVGYFVYRKKGNVVDQEEIVSQVNTKNFPLDNVLAKKNIVPVLVIGSGPAGLSAAMYTSRANLMTVVLTGQEIGGQLTEASYVENWPGKEKKSGLEIMNDLKGQAQHFKAQLVMGEATKVNFALWPFEVTLNTGDIVYALTIVIATGGSQKTLDIPGVKEFWGKGIGVCSICDAPFDKGKDVAIIGGGDAAADRALQLSAFAKNVILLVRAPEMRAAAVVQDYLKNTKNISIQYNVDIKKIIGNERVSGIEIVDKKTNKVSQLPVQSVYFALGFIPRSGLFKGSIDIDSQGFIKLYDHTQQTSKKGIFAAGTVEDPMYQKSATACGDGSKAGMDAINFLQAIDFTPDFAKKIESLLYKIPESSQLIDA